MRELVWLCAEAARECFATSRCTDLLEVLEEECAPVLLEFLYIVRWKSAVSSPSTRNSSSTLWRSLRSRTNACVSVIGCLVVIVAVNL